MQTLGDFYATRAELLYQMGQYPDALTDAEAGLEVCEPASGLSSLLHYLAGEINIQLQHLEAAQLHLSRALAIDEQTCGPDHPDTAATLSVLGGLHLEQAQYAAAEPLLRRALTINEQIFGPDPPYYVAFTLESLATLLEKTGRAEEATAARQRAEGIRKTPS